MSGLEDDYNLMGAETADAYLQLAFSERGKAILENELQKARVREKDLMNLIARLRAELAAEKQRADVAEMRAARVRE